MLTDFPKIIIGQEAICPDGLGRISAYEDNFPFQWIQVDAYVKNRGCHWDYINVKLLSIVGNKD